MQKSKKVLLNLEISIISQLCTLILGLILPRLILLSWGSEYNGLINSVNNIMRYLALLEAGISTSVVQALYKSLGNQNDKETSSIICSAQLYYRRISLIYAVFVIGIAVCYPFVLKTEIPYWEMCLIILLQGCTGVINFAFRAAYQQLLTAEGKYYILSAITLVTNVLTYLGKFVAITVFNNILLMQLFGVLIMGIQVVFYEVLFSKKYKWIDKKAAVNMGLLENRKFYLVQQVAGLVFNSTDTFVLSIMCGLKVASVYTIYNMIFGSLSSIVNLMRSSTNFVLGQTYHSDQKNFKKIYKTYSAFQVSLGSILSSCCIFLVFGFIGLYTKGVADINYINYWAGILFSINLILECGRGTSLAAANVAGKAPNTTWRYVLEATLNLTISLSLVKWLGLCGVLLGTMISGFWRTIDSIVFFNKNVLKQSSFSELIFLFINFVLFIVAVICSRILVLNFDNYLEFVLWGSLIAVCNVIVFGIVFIIMNKSGVKMLLSVLKKRK